MKYEALIHDVADVSLSPRAGLSRVSGAIFRHLVAGVLAIFAFYLSLVATSVPLTNEDLRAVDRAIGVLEQRGFEREAFLLRHVTTFRASDNWLNGFISEENAYAATNFPFGIITIYPDFYSKTQDDTERAMILLHEAQHLQTSGEADAYAYVWSQRHQLGWTQLAYGTTPTYVTVELQTRENAPELFACAVNLWHDCTEPLRARH